MEDIAEGEGLDFNGLSLEEKETLWKEVKRRESLQ
jgi:hypothetical protein